MGCCSSTHQSKGEDKRHHSKEWHVEPTKALDQYACAGNELAEELKYLNQRNESMFDYTQNEEFVELRALLDEPLGRSHFLAFTDLSHEHHSDLVRLWLLLHQYHHMKNNTHEERLETAKNIYRNYFNPRSMSFSVDDVDVAQILNSASNVDQTDEVIDPTGPSSPKSSISNGILPEASSNFPENVKQVIVYMREKVELSLITAIRSQSGVLPRAQRPRGDTITEIIENHCAPFTDPEETPKENNVSLSLDLFIDLQSVAFTTIQPLYHNFKETKAYSQYRDIKKSKYNHVEPNDFVYSNILGKGGFGQVVHVFKKSTGVHYAMKIQAKDTLLKTWKGKMQHVEIERDVLVANRSFPFIVSLRYAFQTKTHAFLCLDLAENGSLRGLIADSPGFQLGQQQVRLYVAEIVLALECLHTHGIIYRDLKPENVLLEKDGHVLLADMGLAGFYYQDKYFEEEQLEHRLPGKPIEATEDDLSDDEGANGLSGPIKSITVQRHDTDCGTPMYRPPEMISHESYGNGVDWFMLGVFTFECLAGYLPFEPKRTCITDSGMIQIETDEQELNCLRRQLVVPSYIDARTKSFLEGLLDLNPDTRLGSGTVDECRDFDSLKLHQYFWALAGPISTSVSWEKVLKKEYTPVHIPPAMELEMKRGFKDVECLIKFMKKALRKEIEDYAKRKNLKPNLSVQGLKEGTAIDSELEHYFDNWDYIDAQSITSELAAKANGDVIKDVSKFRRSLRVKSRKHL